MTEVKRYSQTFLRLNIMNGLFVSAYDYDALRAENERLREELTCLNDEIIDHRNYTKACRERAELQALKGGAVPSGYALVPSEPTGVMKDCGSSVLALIGNGTWTAADCYRAMLAAAPQPAEKAQQVDWRAHSATIAKGEQAPATLETAQAAWARDQELIFDQKAEISRLKETVNQLRQKVESRAQQAERQEPYAWFWSHGSNQGVLTLRQDYEQHKADYPGMKFTAVYTDPQPTQDVSGLVEALQNCVDCVRNSTDDDPFDLPVQCMVRADAALAAHRAK